VFYVIPPSEANLRAYRSWISSANQDEIYFPDTLPDRSMLPISLYLDLKLSLPSPQQSNANGSQSKLAKLSSYQVAGFILSSLQWTP
jgi:hypothetical protein